MFRGINAVSLDAKGRVAMPTRYRDDIVALGDGHVVVTISPNERCLWMYPYIAWQKIEEKLVALPSLDPNAERLKKILIGHASDCELDRNGRVLLAGPLREFAGLNKRVMLVGQLNKFEVWNEELWEARRDELLSPTAVSQPISIELESLSL